MHTHPTVGPNPHPYLVIPLTPPPPQLPGHVDEIGHDVVLVTPVYLPETRAKRQLRRRVLRHALKNVTSGCVTQCTFDILT